jgi:hypothetical protein
MMKKHLALLACALLALPSLALAQSLSATLTGGTQVPGPGDADGSGVATVNFAGTTVSYTLLVNSIAAPTAAHIHRGAAGASGNVVIDFAPTFAGGLATGSVTADAALIAEILSNPAGFYVNVHNAEFAAGAIRGQLGSGETVTEAYFPVISRADGLNNTKFRTNLRIGNPNAADITVTAEWYPDTTEAAAGAATSTPIVVVAGGQAVIDDAVDTLFAGGNRNGAMKLTCAQAFGAMVSIYNDQRNNTTIPESLRGTYAQFSKGLGIDEAYAKGMLLGLSDRRDGSTLDARTNLGYFNPTGAAVTVTFTAKKADGTVLGTTQATIPAYANKIDKVFDIITGVPADQRTQANFFVTYEATGGPLFVYASTVDNKTGDGLNIVPLQM